MEPRKSFYDSKVNIKRANKVLEDLVKQCSLSEILWIVRQIAFDQVAYFSEENKGIVYRDAKYSRLTIDQANNLQRQLSVICDLFSQSICDGREFEPNYLKQYDFAGSYIMTIDNLKEQLNSLQSQINEIKTN